MTAPIAIVGQACVLPGALDVAAFAENVFAGRDLITDAPEGRTSTIAMEVCRWPRHCRCLTFTPALVSASA